MSWQGDLIKAGIVSDGKNIHIPSGNITSRNFYPAYGNVYYVDGSVSTTSSGVSWDRPFKTIAEAISVCNARIDWAASRWANLDIIRIAAGSYAENLTSLPHGCFLVGENPDDMKDGQTGVKIAPAAGSPIDVGAFVNGGFYNIGFHSVGSYAVFDAEILNNVVFERCYFTGPVETSTAAAGIVSNDSVKLTVRDCRFSCMDKGIDINYADGGDSFSHALIIDSIFDQIDTAGIEISTNLVGPSSWVIRCFFAGGGVTMATGILDNVGILDLVDCRITATDPVNGCRSANGCYGNGALLDSTGE